MSGLINLYSTKQDEIKKFLKLYYLNDVKLTNNLLWEKEFDNPIDMSDLIGIFIDNNDKFKINMWVSFDPNYYINITNYNADKIIRYLFERYPY